MGLIGIVGLLIGMVAWQGADRCGGAVEVEIGEVGLGRFRWVFFFFVWLLWPVSGFGCCLVSGFGGGMVAVVFGWFFHGGFVGFVGGFGGGFYGFCSWW